MNTRAKELSPVVEAADIKTLQVNPLMILQAAIEKGIDADQLEKLMTLQERWEANQARKAFDAAMADFQAHCPIIKKTREADRYWYAPLDEVLRTIRPHLEATGLSVRFSTETEGPVITAICTVSHRDGHSEVSHFTAPIDEQMRVNETQKMGSANTYAKRYALMNALNLAAGNEDDDGVRASHPPPTAEEVAAHEKAKANRKPQDPATDEQLAEIQKHIDVLKKQPESKRTTTQLEYWLKNKDHMTKSDAAEILRRLQDGV